MIIDICIVFGYFSAVIIMLALAAILARDRRKDKFVGEYGRHDDRWLDEVEK